MRCDDARELFSDYVSDDMEPALRVTLESHLSDCLRCRSEAEDVRLLWNRLDNAELIDPPAGLHTQIMARVAASQAQPSTVSTQNSGRWDWRRLTQPRALAFAAAAVLVMLAGVQTVQTQRAAMGPFDFVFRLIHPTQAASPFNVRVLRGTWVPGVTGGGAVTLRLRVSTSGDGHGGPVSYDAKVVGVQGTGAQGTIGGDKEVTLGLPVTVDPSSDAVRVSVLLTSAEGDSMRRDITVPVSPTTRDDRIMPQRLGTFDPNADR